MAALEWNEWQLSSGLGGSFALEYAIKLESHNETTQSNHFLSQLKSKIELNLPPRPTDSVLKRHHDALVAAELEYRLTVIFS